MAPDDVAPSARGEKVDMTALSDEDAAAGARSVQAGRRPKGVLGDAAEAQDDAVERGG